MAKRKSKKKGSSHRKSHKRVEAGKKSARTRKRRKAERAASRKKSKRHGGKRRSHRSSKRRSKKRRSHAKETPRRSRKKRSKRKSRRGGKRRSSRRRRKKSHAHETPRRRSRKRRSSRRRRHGGKRRSSRRRHTRRSRRNPASIGEYVTTGLTFGAGAVLAEVADRFVATHALGASVSGATGTDGKPLFGDTPPTSGSYAGLFNGTAVVAPMNLVRWGVAVAMTGVPIAIATWGVKGPKMRAAFVGLGLGAGVRTLLKGFNDLSGKLLGRTAMGARLFDNEARAQAVQALAQGGADTTGNFPNSGLGKAMGCGSCANCKAGVGACCGNLSGNANGAQPPAQPPAPPPVNVQPPPAPPAPPPPPAPPLTVAPAVPGLVFNPAPGAPPAPAGIRGVPNGVRQNPWLWGEGT